MNREEAVALVKAFDVKAQTDVFDPAKLDNIMIEGRMNSGGPRGSQPVRKVVFPSDPEWASLVSMLTGEVQEIKADAEATIAEVAAVGTASIEVVK